jgi:hypothetical protein
MFAWNAFILTKQTIISCSLRKNSGKSIFRGLMSHSSLNHTHRSLTVILTEPWHRFKCLIWSSQTRSWDGKLIFRNFSVTNDKSCHFVQTYVIEILTKNQKCRYLMYTSQPKKRYKDFWKKKNFYVKTKTIFCYHLRQCLREAMGIVFSVCVGREGGCDLPPFENQDGLLKSVELRILMLWRKTMSHREFIHHHILWMSQKCR